MNIKNIIPNVLNSEFILKYINYNLDGNKNYRCFNKLTEEFKLSK